MPASPDELERRIADLEALVEQQKQQLETANAQLAEQNNLLELARPKWCHVHSSCR